MKSSLRTLSGPSDSPTLLEEIRATNWLYTAKVDGEIQATQLILTDFQGRTEFPYAQSALKGSATFSGTQMRLTLEVTAYVDGKSIDHYDPSRLNGVYRLSFR
jgi:hypothetical protein